MSCGGRSIQGMACLVLAMLLFPAALLHAAENRAFTLQLNNHDPQTIGDMKPAFVVYKDKDIPKVSIKYILKRYIKLFETSNAPDVRIDALNRINNLSAKYGLTSKKLTIDKVKQSAAVLESYDTIVDSGIFYERMDELLYQTAKASLFIGTPEESIKRLKLLVGLYPRSLLADESMFRLAEAYFDLGDYEKAEAQYKKVIAFARDDEFHQRSRFKLAWAEFRLDRYQSSGLSALQVLGYHPSLKDQTEFSFLSEHQQDVIEDSLRLLAILFSKQEGPQSLEALQATLGHQQYAYLLYDALFRFYLKQDRFEESALTASAYASRYAELYQAYQMALNAIQAYEAGEFDIRAWGSKEEFVANFGISSHYWQQRDEQQQTSLRPFLSEYLGQLAHLYYIRMQEQRSKKTQQHREFGLRSAAYYQELVATHPQHEDNGESLFLAAEALREVGEPRQAIELYSKAAYGYAPHRYSLTAGYNAVLTFDALHDDKQPLSDQLRQQRRASIEQYAQAFPNDQRSPVLLNELANELFNEADFSYALSSAQRVLEFPELENEVVYSSQLIRAHSLFELSRFHDAEQAYTHVLANPLSRDQRVAHQERLAAAIYHQAEAESDPARSAELYLKVVDTVPTSSIVPQALIDAAAQQMTLANWGAAIAALSHFETRFPQHEQKQATIEKLIFSYSENEEWVPAADKLLELAALTKDTEQAVNASFQAAEFYKKSGFDSESTHLFEAFVAQYPGQFLLSVEAYDHILQFYERTGDDKLETWQKGFVAYESQHQTLRNERSAELAANTAYQLAIKDVAAFEAAALRLPLKQSLKQKKQLLSQATTSMQAVAQYGVPFWQAAATHQIAALYQILARDILQSERPASLDALQLEQYDILLEEQAYPFEEQALEVFALNTARAPQGQYDEWVRKSFTVLAEMNPSAYKRDVKVRAYADTIF